MSSPLLMLVLLWISGCCAMTLPGLDASEHIADTDSFLLPSYLKPKVEVSKEPIQTTSSPPTHVVQSNVSPSGDTFSKYLIQSIENMDSNSLKTLSQIINLEIKKQIPSAGTSTGTATILHASNVDTLEHQPPQKDNAAYQKTPSHQYNVQTGVQQSSAHGQSPHSMYPSSGSYQQTPSHQYNLQTGVQQSSAHGQSPHSVYPSSGSYQQTPSHQYNMQTGVHQLSANAQSPHGMYPMSGSSTTYNLHTNQGLTQPSETNQNVNTPQAFSQSQFNPAYMIMSGMGGSGINIGQKITSTQGVSHTGKLVPHTEVSNNPGFDPNKLMAVIEAETAKYDPNSFLTKQNYITTDQWNYPNGQGSPGPQQMNQAQIETKPKPNERPSFMSNAQINFEPDAMMAALGMKEHKFSFDPDKINSFGSEFQPGKMPQLSDMKQPPNNMFNADSLNQKLMSYSGAPMSQQKQRDDQGYQQAAIAYNPDTFNHPSVNIVPTTYKQFMTNENSVTPQPSGETLIADEHGSVPPANYTTSQQSQTSTSPPQNPKTNVFRPGTLFANYAKQTKPSSKTLSPSLDKSMGNVFSFAGAFQAVAFNPDQVNAAQQKYNPNSVMKSLFDVEPFSNPRMEPRKMLRTGNATAVILNTTSELQAKNNSTQTPSTSSTSPPHPQTTIKPESVSKAMTPSPNVFNPNKVNAGIEQSINFEPGSLMMGFNNIPTGQINNLGNSAFSPGVAKPMSNFLSAIMPAMMGDSNEKLTKQPTGMSAMFDPSSVNNAKMSFNLNQQMGISSGNSDQIFDPMKVNIMSMQSPGQSSKEGAAGPFNSNNAFLSSGEMNMMDTAAFVGSFDPNQVNQASMTDVYGGSQNTANHTSNANFMSAFLGMGSLGGSIGNAFGGNFNPADVNNAVFNPNDVNSAQMNFDPSNMLNRNPGYDTEKATQTDFDPTKINSNVHMHFLPSFLPDKESNENNTTNMNSGNFNSGFTPGQLSPNGNAMVFDPTSINQVSMHFSAMDILNQSPPGVSGGENNTNFPMFNPNSVNQASMLFSPMGNINTQDLVPVFDPVAINNMQMNHSPISVTLPTVDSTAESLISTDTTPTASHQTATQTVVPSTSFPTTYDASVITAVKPVEGNNATTSTNSQNNRTT